MVMIDNKIKDASLVSPDAKASQAAAEQCEIKSLWNRFVMKHGGDADYSAQVLHSHMNKEGQYADFSDVDACNAATYMQRKTQQYNQAVADYKAEQAEQAAQQASQNLKEKTEKKENGAPE